VIHLKNRSGEKIMAKPTVKAASLQARHQDISPDTEPAQVGRVPSSRREMTSSSAVLEGVLESVSGTKLLFAFAGIQILTT